MSSLVTCVFVICCFVQIWSTEAHVFSCDFESNSTCGIENGSPFDPQQPLVNFTIRSPATITYPDLGPFSGRHFLYWSRPDDDPHAEEINGQVHTPRFYQTDGENMCVQFKYFVKSTGTDNGTWLDVSTGGCYAASLFFAEQDDSGGWQTVMVPLHEGNCSISVYFTMNQRTPVRVAVALDDIVVDWCDALVTTTTPQTSSSSARSVGGDSLLLTLFMLIILK